MREMPSKCQCYIRDYKLQSTITDDTEAMSFNRDPYPWEATFDNGSRDFSAKTSSHRSFMTNLQSSFNASWRVGNINPVSVLFNKNIYSQAVFLSSLLRPPLFLYPKELVSSDLSVHKKFLPAESHNKIKISIEMKNLNF